MQHPMDKNKVIIKRVEASHVNQVYAMKLYATQGSSTRSFKLVTGNIDESVLNKIKRLLNGFHMIGEDE